MKKYRIASALMMIHGGFLELGGALCVLPLLFLGTDRFDFGKYFAFRLPYFQENLYLMMLVGAMYGVLRLIGAVGLLKNRMWGFVLSVINWCHYACTDDVFTSGGNPGRIPCRDGPDTSADTVFRRPDGDAIDDRLCRNSKRPKGDSEEPQYCLTSKRRRVIMCHICPEALLMQMRTIDANELYKLIGCLGALAEYHNAVSLHFGGSYPSRPCEQTIELFSVALKEGRSQIAVIEERGEIVGFCKLDFSAVSGKIDYLIVLPAYRGRGFGGAFLDWAMQTFRQRGVKNIEVKVVAGNDVIRLYEKYGFQINAQILRLDLLYAAATIRRFTKAL